MAWLSSFLLGRPGQEFEFEVNPAAMDIEETGIVVLQRNLAGDLKKSTLRASAPIIRISSNYLTLLQRNQFNSLVEVSDTFLSFQTRDDWQQIGALATILSSTEVQLASSSALRLSTVLVDAGFASIITIDSVSYSILTDEGFGNLPFGDGPFGDFDPGTITYDDLTRIITISNPLPDLTIPVYVNYTYKGWLVNMDRFAHSAQGGWLDRFKYDFTLTGA